MSKQVATLIVGLLAFAEGRTDNINYLREADREDVLDEISHDTLDRIAHRLYASESENLSAYERLLKDDKRKKMDYLNSIRPDLLPENRNQPASAEDYDNSKDHYTVDDIPNQDPAKESIRDKVLRESQRRQNDLMEAKRLNDELNNAQKERQEREEELSAMTPEEREQKRKEDKWRREFEREQHALAEQEERMRKSNDLTRYQEELARREYEEHQRDLEDQRRHEEELIRHRNDLARKD